MARFTKGQSGNPKGKPKGAKDKRTALRALLEPHAEDLVKKVVQLAKEGDTTALRLCLERLIPPLRARDTPALLENSGGTLTEQGEGILRALAQGKLTPSEGAAFMGAVTAQARIVEVDDLERRIAALEEKNVP